MHTHQSHSNTTATDQLYQKTNKQPPLKTGPSSFHPLFLRPASSQPQSLQGQVEQVFHSRTLTERVKSIFPVFNHPKQAKQREAKGLEAIRGVKTHLWVCWDTSSHHTSPFRRPSRGCATLHLRTTSANLLSGPFDANPPRRRLCSMWQI